MLATSEQAKPAATVNTCGAMMVGSNQSKDAMNDGKTMLRLQCKAQPYYEHVQKLHICSNKTWFT